MFQTTNQLGIETSSQLCFAPLRPPKHCHCGTAGVPPLGSSLARFFAFQGCCGNIPYPKDYKYGWILTKNTSRDSKPANLLSDKRLQVFK